MSGAKIYLDSYLDTCKKQDIPEVQAVIEILRAEASSTWTGVFEEALIDLDEQLDAIDDVAPDEATDELLLVAVFQTLS
ncbi:MAG TPA: hypothetical protein DF699_10200, partial [Phycisphaerales bacterium]|nr:hypothetical protein [Phycisphaerales bacterium]